MRDGWGVELRHHGERYEGEWRNGLREGLGVLTCANSQRANLASKVSKKHTFSPLSFGVFFLLVLSRCNLFRDK